MASGDGSHGTSDGLGREERTKLKSLGLATQENKMSAALESLSGPEKLRNPKILPTRNVAQDLTLSKGKQALQDSKCGHDSVDPNKPQSSTSWPIGSFRDGPGIFPSSIEERIIALGPSSSKNRLIQTLQETVSQTDSPDPTQSNLEGVAATGAPAGATAVEPNVGSVVALLGEASLEPNGGFLVVLNDVGRAEPNVGPIVVLHGEAPAQSNVALSVAPPSEVLAQPNIPPNVAPPASAVVASNDAPRRVAPVQPDVAPHAQRNGAPPVPEQPNAALIVAPPGVALAQPNGAAIVAPPAVVVLNVNLGLNRSRLKPLRICELGSEGHFWPKLP